MLPPSLLAYVPRACLKRPATPHSGLQPQDRVLDLFCGTGTIALVLARHCRSVIGVDGSRAAITDARSNAQLNNITNASFWVADLASQRGVATLMEQLGQVDVIVAGGPRMMGQKACFDMHLIVWTRVLLLHVQTHLCSCMGPHLADAVLPPSHMLNLAEKKHCNKPI